MGVQAVVIHVGDVGARRRAGVQRRQRSKRPPEDRVRRTEEPVRIKNIRASQGPVAKVSRFLTEVARRGHIQRDEARWTHQSIFDVDAREAMSEQAVDLLGRLLASRADDKG